MAHQTHNQYNGNYVHND